MLKSLKIRTTVLAIHGALILALGLAFLYLRANMTNLLFDVIDLGIAVLFAVGVLILAALVDWIAAFGEGIEHLRRFAFYLLGGLGLALCGVFLVYSPYGSMALVLLFTAAHALIFSISLLAFHRGVNHRTLHRGAIYTVGACSLLFAVAMAVLATRNDEPSATALLGAYLCFVGARTLLSAWGLHRTTVLEEKAKGNLHHVDVGPASITAH